MVAMFLVTMGLAKRVMAKQARKMTIKRKHIVATTSDTFCFHCRHTEHGRQMPNHQQVENAVGKAAAGLAVNLVRDGNPLVTGIKFLGGLLPRDRCYGCGEDWRPQQKETLRRHDAEAYTAKLYGGCLMYSSAAVVAAFAGGVVAQLLKVYIQR